MNEKIVFNIDPVYRFTKKKNLLPAPRRGARRDAILLVILLVILLDEIILVGGVYASCQSVGRPRILK